MDLHFFFLLNSFHISVDTGHCLLFLNGHGKEHFIAINACSYGISPCTLYLGFSLFLISFWDLQSTGLIITCERCLFRQGRLGEISAGLFCGSELRYNFDQNWRSRVATSWKSASKKNGLKTTSRQTDMGLATFYCS